MKTLRESAAELGIPEAELRAMIDMHKVRAVWKKGQLAIAPDEIARIRRSRKTLESALRPGATPAPPKPTPKPAPARTVAPKPAAAAASRPAVAKPAAPKPATPPQ
jgi:hypothetical protein